MSTELLPFRAVARSCSAVLLPRCDHRFQSHELDTPHSTAHWQIQSDKSSCLRHITNLIISCKYLSPFVGAFTQLNQMCWLHLIGCESR